jgi:predicted metal-dependent hydrolase
VGNKVAANKAAGNKVAANKAVGGKVAANKAAADKRESRRVETLTGLIEYELTWKAVKRINLRVSRTGEVKVSLPKGLPAGQADRFVREKALWLEQTRKRLAQERQREAERLSRGEQARPGILGAETTPAEREARAAACLPLFTQVCRLWLPAFAPWRVAMPDIRIRQMKSRWGSCNPRKGLIVLNSLLERAPLGCLEYVVAHELAHFVVPNHSPSFHRVMARVMPDYQKRRQALRVWAG